MTSGFDFSRFVDAYANTKDLDLWAEQIIGSRPPDFVIGHAPLGDYLRRWYVVPRNAGLNLYLHEFVRSDDDRALHDHPWDNASMILRGEYDEHMPGEVIRRSAGDVVSRSAADRHRVELVNEAPVVTLFATGPKIREWGFWCDGGDRFVHWRDFTSEGDRGSIGRGCS